MAAHEVSYIDANRHYISLPEFVRLAGLVAAGAAHADEIAALMCEWDTRIQITETEGGCDIASYTAGEAYNAYFTMQLSKTVLGDDVYRMECQARDEWEDLINGTARHIDAIAARMDLPVVTAPVVRNLAIVQ